MFLDLSSFKLLSLRKCTSAPPPFIFYSFHLSAVTEKMALSLVYTNLTKKMAGGMLIPYDIKVALLSLGFPLLLFLGGRGGDVNLAEI